MNPVWKRELRARWRGWRAFALVFFMVFVLATVFTWQYGENARYLAQDGSDPRQRLSLMGHNLFALLAWLQVLLWMLMAPVLTATSITFEREKGLLEGLQLSDLRASQIVVGKLLSSLSLIALLIVVTLPITAVCFLMGGVSPGEFILVCLLHFGTAICCAAVGLAVSGWCRNSMTAIILSLVVISAWSGLAYVSAFAAFGGFSRTPTLPTWPWRQIFELLVKAHPVVAALDVADLLSPSGGSAWATTTPSWVTSLIFMSALTATSLLIAALGTRRILIDSRRVEWKKLKKQLQVHDVTNRDRPKTKSPEPATPVKKPEKRWELGVLARMQFSNPILGREVRACFRPHSTSVATLILAGLLAPFALFAYAAGIYNVVFDAWVRQPIGSTLLGMYLILTILLCAVLSASGFAREREGGTWEALRLSLLSRREILWGKMGAPLIICAVCGVFFLPILLPCIRSVAVVKSNSGAGISITQFLAALAIIASSAWCFTLFGLLISRFSRRSVTAICCTMGVLFVTLVAIPAYISSDGSSESWDFLTMWHPFLALVNLFDTRVKYDETGQYTISSSIFDIASPSVCLLALTGGLCYLVLWCELYSSKKSEAH